MHLFFEICTDMSTCVICRLDDGMLYKKQIKINKLLITDMWIILYFINPLVYFDLLKYKAMSIYFLRVLTY